MSATSTTWECKPSTHDRAQIGPRPRPLLPVGDIHRGPFPKSKNQCRYIVVAVDYATKWVEAKPLSKIREKEMIEFFMEYIFEKALEELKIQHIKASVTYPQANGLAQKTNRTILQGLKKRIEEVPRYWVDELPNILWSYRMTPRSATRETPFHLAYGIDDVLPIDVSLISLRIEVFDPSSTIEGIRFHNELIEETREQSRLRMIAQ
ncbi:uncharacterized protein LOC141665728 [Apium graveolens]|uniref:uncharacterized protein LOC141665728 n=1 Tax=Apium graveolens TaxID=4045 RepID=UPI003D7A196A